MDDRNAGLAVFETAIGMLIAFAVGYLVFRLVKPSTDPWGKSTNNYGRLFLAHTLFYLFFGLVSLSFFPPRGMDGINFLLLLALTAPIVGSLSYLIGYFYGKSKPLVVKSVKESKTIIKTPIDKTVKKPIKKTVEKLQELKTKKNTPNNNKTMDEENSEEINDEEYYLIATKEVEKGNINSALWAKCMAISEGDEKKSKYCYINRRVEILTNEAQADKENRIEAVAEAKRVAEEEEAKRVAEEAEAETLERIVSTKKGAELLKTQGMYYEYNGIKFKSKADMESYVNATKRNG